MVTLYSKKDNIHAGIWVEKEADKGVMYVADKVAEDISEVTGCQFAVSVCEEKALPQGKNIILFAQDKKSPILNRLEAEGRIELADLHAKWEVFTWKLLANPWEGAENVLLIAGSDKRGTIYGMFELSETAGISPLVYWADAVIPSRQEIVLDESMERTSKEPSVQYRGFFINDEWPCFGNWTTDHFGGFTAKMYDKVFELLLRLKGNCLWPAMWSSSFDWDGPGNESALLADKYGVIIGNSHHEPCLRAGEEWDKVRGENSPYGNAWSFLANREGLLKYWRDSLEERCALERMITIGMRGERDSKVLGADATIKDNIQLLRDIIHEQKKLIGEMEEKYNKEFPELLVLYKEVEEYFYGSPEAEGLCDSEELRDVILMLCDDNFGNVRTLPDDKLQKHPGGFGMYYHFDYHGDPISYEWINSTPLTKTWEQMTMAYEFGIRRMWIVNVGDLKFNEYPLSYFLALAYDFEKWGTTAPNTCMEYTEGLVKKHFAGSLEEKDIREATEILMKSVALNHLRRPEALQPATYHSCHYNEAQRVLVETDDLLKRHICLERQLSGKVQEAYNSLIGFHAAAVTNHLQMNLYAGKNHFYAAQGRKTANACDELVGLCMTKDKKLAEEIRSFKAGKWNGMEKAIHVGFRKWNDDGCKYPVRMRIEPFERPRLVVAAVDRNEYYEKNYGKPLELYYDDFRYENRTWVETDVINDGIGTLDYQVEMPECRWLSCNSIAGTVSDCERIRFICNRELLSEQEETAIVRITDGDTVVQLRFAARKNDVSQYHAGTFLPDKGIYAADAVHYTEARLPEGTTAVVLEDFGLAGSAVKLFPVTKQYAKGEEPVLFYDMAMEKAGTYDLELQTTPANPLNRQGILRFGVSVNEGSTEYYNTVPGEYRIGEAGDKLWAEGVLHNRRLCKCRISAEKGVNRIGIHLPDAGMAVERILVSPEGCDYPDSYLGPQESPRVK